MTFLRYTIHKMKHFSFRHSVTYGLIALSLLMSIVGSVALPYISGHDKVLAQEANGASDVNLPQRGASFRSSDKIPYATCYGQVQNNVTKDDSLLSDQFYKNIQDLPYDSDPTKLKDDYTSLFGRDIVSYIGTYHGASSQNDFNADQIVYILKNKGQMTVPIIRFHNASTNAKPLHGIYSSNSSVCGDIVMIPVNNTTWRGFQLINPEKSDGEDGRYMYMEFHETALNGGNVVGTLTYWSALSSGTPGGSLFASQINHYSDNNVQIAGLPTFSGSGNGSSSSGNTVNGGWTDVSTIVLDQSKTNGEYSGEIFQKNAWSTAYDPNTKKNYSVYFLTNIPVATGQNVLSSGKACDNPFPIGSQCSSGSPNCVPFIAVDAALNVSTTDKNLGGLQSGINKLGGAKATLYDYDSSGNCNQNKTSNVALNSQSNAKIWLAYSTKNDAYVTMFSTGDGNEIHYISEYKKKSVGQYVGGQDSCNGIISGTPLTTPTSTWDVKFSLYDSNCNAPQLYGTVIVTALGGDRGEAAFSTAVTGIANAANKTSNAQPKLGCDLLDSGQISLNWLVCPIISSAESAAGALDNLINKELTVNVGDIFGTGQAAQGYRRAWGTFRVFALAVIVLAALTMIIAQAAGVEFLEGYTGRKILFRLVIAAIGISLSWSLLQFAIQLSNDLGNGIRTVIYSPFSGLSSNGVSINGGSTAVLTLIGTGAALAFGWVGLLSFALTGLLAVLIAFALLVFRSMLVVFLVILAPVAIACYILPNTQKVWKLWRDSFVGALLVFLIISGIIAAGRVFAVTSLAAANGNVIGQLIAIASYFGGYFLITTAFRMAGGFMATVGGFVNDRSRGAFDRLKNYRKKTVADRGQRMKSGQLFSNSNGLARAFNTTTRNIGLGARGRFGLGARGRAGAAQNTMVASGQIAQSEGFKANAEDDDFLWAATFNSAGEARAALSRRWGDAARASDAVAKVQAAGLKFGQPLAVAAAQQLVNTGTGYEDIRDMTQTLARVSNGNGNVATSLAGYANAAAKKNRTDLTPGFGDLNGLVHRTMSGGAGAVSDAEYAQATIKGVAESGPVGQTAATSKPVVFKNLHKIAEDISSGKYGEDSEDVRAMVPDLAKLSMELRSSSYGMTTANATQVVETANQLGDAVRYYGGEAVETGTARVYQQTDPVTGRPLYGARAPRPGEPGGPEAPGAPGGPGGPEPH
jgi:hypothetical protein